MSAPNSMRRLRAIAAALAPMAGQLVKVQAVSAQESWDAGRSREAHLAVTSLGRVVTVWWGSAYGYPPAWYMVHAYRRICGDLAPTAVAEAIRDALVPS